MVARTPTSFDKYPSQITGDYSPQKVENRTYISQTSAKYEIGQAYNKGGFQVLSKKETKEESTGKRR